MFAMHFGLQL